MSRVHTKMHDLLRDGKATQQQQETGRKKLKNTLQKAQNKTERKSGKMNRQTAHKRMREKIITQSGGTETAMEVNQHSQTTLTETMTKPCRTRVWKEQ